MRHWVALNAIASVLALTAAGHAAFANGSGKPPASSSAPTFSSRSDRPDGSSFLTMGRRLPIEWETKLGTDVNLAPQASIVPSENILRGIAADNSSGAIWGSIAMPMLQPLGFDKTAVHARIDGGKDEGKVGASLSRSIALDENLSVTWSNAYSITQSLGSTAPAGSPVPLTSAVPADPAAPSTHTRTFDQALRLNIASSGTTLAAGASSSLLDDHWRNKLSIEQTLVGPLKVTTSVEGAGSTESKKSITAGFKSVW
jgi:hypothetical protein